MPKTTLFELRQRCGVKDVVVTLIEKRFYSKVIGHVDKIHVCGVLDLNVPKYLDEIGGILK